MRKRSLGSDEDEDEGGDIYRRTARGGLSRSSARDWQIKICIDLERDNGGNLIRGNMKTSSFASIFCAFISSRRLHLTATSFPIIFVAPWVVEKTTVGGKCIALDKESVRPSLQAPLSFLSPDAQFTDRPRIPQR